MPSNLWNSTAEQIPSSIPMVTCSGTPIVGMLDAGRSLLQAVTCTEPHGCQACPDGCDTSQPDSCVGSTRKLFKCVWCREITQEDLGGASFTEKWANRVPQADGSCGEIYKFSCSRLTFCKLCKCWGNTLLSDVHTCRQAVLHLGSVSPHGEPCSAARQCNAYSTGLHARTCLIGACAQNCYWCLCPVQAASQVTQWRGKTTRISV